MDLRRIVIEGSNQYHNNYYDCVQTVQNNLQHVEISRFVTFNQGNEHSLNIIILFLISQSVFDVNSLTTIEEKRLSIFLSSLFHSLNVRIYILYEEKTTKELQVTL